MLVIEPEDSTDNVSVNKLESNRTKYKGKQRANVYQVQLSTREVKWLPLCELLFYCTPHIDMSLLHIEGSSSAAVELN